MSWFLTTLLAASLWLSPAMASAASTLVDPAFVSWPSAIVSTVEESTDDSTTEDPELSLEAKSTDPSPIDGEMKSAEGELPPTEAQGKTSSSPTTNTDSLTKGVFSNFNMPAIFKSEDTTLLPEYESTIQAQQDEIQARARENLRRQQLSMEKTEAQQQSAAEKRQATLQKIQEQKAADELERKEKRAQELAARQADGGRPAFEFNLPKISAPSFPNMKGPSIMDTSDVDRKLNSAFDYVNQAWQRESEYMKQRQR